MHPMTPSDHRHQRAMEDAALPTFLDELEATWGVPWGASDEVGALRRVLVRTPGEELGIVSADAWSEADQALVDPDGRWYWTDRRAPDLERVRAEHAGLVAALRAEGVVVDDAGPLGGAYTKAIYVRDPLVTIPGGAIVGRMGVRMRRGEEAAITRTVAGLGMPILGTIAGAGTLEGGSFVKLRPDCYVLGTSIRCNQEGAAQLRALLAIHGHELLVVPISGWSIHIDLHLAVLDVDRVLVDAPRLPYDFLVALRARGFELIEADSREPWGLNLLCLRPGRVLMADSTPRTAELLTRHGVEVVTIPYDEIQKNGGGVHCSTMELTRDPA
jgi:N-dimethylarginine dimethylaminohydrolase